MTKKPTKKQVVDQRAEAAKEIAKVAGKAINSANRVGAFFNRVFGSAIEDTVGLVGDPLRSFRPKRLAEIQIKTDAYLHAKGVEATAPISPRLAYKLLQDASLEDDPELSDRYARMLAEALDPNGVKVTRQHGDVLGALGSELIVLLDYCWKYRLQSAQIYSLSGKISYQPTRGSVFAIRSLAEVSRTIGTTEDTIRHAIQLGILRTHGSEYNVFPWHKRDLGEVGFRDRFEKVTIYGDIEDFTFTDFGVSFCEAVVAPICPKS